MIPNKAHSLRERSGKEIVKRALLNHSHPKMTACMVKTLSYEK